MSEIICPHCKKDLTANDASYADLLKQARDSELEAEVNELKAVQQRTLTEIEKSLEELHEELQEKDALIAELKAEYETASA